MRRCVPACSRIGKGRPGQCTFTSFAAWMRGVPLHLNSAETYTPA
jgi:hypothetical protein